MMKLNDQDAVFRDEVRVFLAQMLTPELRDAGRRCSGIFTDYPDGIRWQRILNERGWSVPHWPVEHGGTGWTPMQQYIFASELAAANAPPLAPMGTHMVGPVIIAFGTPEQKKRWLPGIRNGDDYWAQGYSEPQAGSDLASLQCKAVREGDEYVINGSKIWTTHAQYANRMFLLVRTSNVGKPQMGISFLCLDLKRPGVTVRPIISISGDHELNQVFFDDVRVPASGLIGEENQGWTIAKFLLQHERGGAWAPMLRGRLHRLHQALAEAFSEQRPTHPERAELRSRLAELECRVDAVGALELRALAAHARNEPPGIWPSIGKLQGSETRQLITEVGLDIAAHYSQAHLPLALAENGELLRVPEVAVFSMSAYLNDRAASIYAGTNEVQRNLVAAQLLAGRLASETFALAETQTMLRDSLDRFLSEQYDIELRARTLDAAEREPALWYAFAQQLGLLGAGFVESQGGLGGGLRDQFIIAETLGRHLAAEPYLSCVVLVGHLLSHAGGDAAQQLLGQLIQGDALPVPALTEPGSRYALDDAIECSLHPSIDASGVWRLSGRKSMVHNGPWGSHFLVLARHGDGLSLALVAANQRGLTRRDYRTVDGCRASELAFDHLPVTPEQLIGKPGHALELLEPAYDAATLAICAEACGVLTRLLQDSLAYTLERRQFGQPIANFQALQHRLADMAIALEQLKAVTAWAAELVGEDVAQPASAVLRQRAVSSAKVCAAEACRLIGQGAVQLHGAMGMTDELAVGHYFRRATQIERRFGSASHHVRRIADLLGG